MSNNKKKKYYSITWAITAYEQATIGQGSKEYIEQNGGTFFDLIPAGMSVSVDSIQIKTLRNYLNEEDFEYTITPNYKNTGRDLLIVKVKESADIYTLYFDTVID